MKKLIWPLSLFFLVACASSGPRAEPYYTRLFNGNFDTVWISALKALNDYPLKLSNKDAGKIQSEIVNGPYNDLMFTHPDTVELPERFRYSIRLNFAKLSTDDRQPLTRVRIIKELEKFNDFYTGWAGQPSDGIEERVLLYRIEHLLQMEKTLAKP